MDGHICIVGPEPPYVYSYIGNARQAVHTLGLQVHNYGLGSETYHDRECCGEVKCGDCFHKTADNSNISERKTGVHRIMVAFEMSYIT